MNREQPQSIERMSEEDKLSLVIAEFEQRAETQPLVPILMEAKRTPKAMELLDHAFNMANADWRKLRDIEDPERLEEVRANLTALLQACLQQNQEEATVAAKKVAEMLG